MLVESFTLLVLELVITCIALLHKDATLGQNKLIGLTHLFEEKPIEKKTKNKIFSNFRSIVYIIQCKSFTRSKD